MRTLLALFMSSILAHAADPLIFISAFASGEKAGIHAFHFDGATGALKPAHRTSDIQNPFFLAVSKDQRCLYAVNAEKFGDKEDEKVAAYAIQRDTGALSKLNEQSSKGTATCYLDALGKTVVLANYSSGSVASLPVNSDGSLAEAASFIQHSGSSVDPDRQKGPNAHSIVIAPNGRFAFAADLGIDKVMIYRLDPTTAKLSVNEAQPFVTMKPGSGPRHITFHPNGRVVYVINELANTITVFDYAPESGRLTEHQTISTLRSDFKGKSYTADVKVTPDGRYLYGTNRGHDSIAAYRVGNDGKLTLIAIEPSLGKGPQNLLITPDGNWLLCANMPGNSVTVFRIDHSIGSLKSSGQSIEMPMPSCIRWVD